MGQREREIEERTIGELKRAGVEGEGRRRWNGAVGALASTGGMAGDGTTCRWRHHGHRAEVQEREDEEEGSGADSGE